MKKFADSFWKGECKFIAGATTLEQIPRNLNLPEIAFVGRSNVGKSSLINALIGKSCCRVSKQPGRTQQINFFSLSNSLLFVDLPGYGYASVSKQTRKLWDNLIVDYLQSEINLKRVFLLIDSRHGIKDNDMEIMNLLDSFGLVYQFVLTKIDKTPNLNEVIDSIKNLIDRHGAAYSTIISTSSEKKIGIQNLKFEISRLY